MPDAVEVFFSSSLKEYIPNFLSVCFKHLAVQIVEFGPRQFSVLNAIHVGTVDRSPCVGEGSPVDLQSLGFAELLAFGDNARPPIDDGAEDVEGEDLYLVRA